VEINIGIAPRSHTPHQFETAASPTASDDASRAAGKLVRDAWLKSNARVDRPGG